MPVTYNLQSITAKLANAPKVKKEALSIVKKNIETAKNEMLEAFDNHKVTKEIEAGESTNNSSGLLYGYGNLFSFIGFNEGDEPIELVRNILKLNTGLKSDSDKFVRFSGGGTIIFGFDVKIPSKDELYEKTEYPGENRAGSWLEGIERGLYGLKSYLYDDTGKFEEYDSRSTTGLQAKSGQKVIIVRKGDARTIKYITEILKVLENSLKKNK
jgi:hypothetical protein